MSEITYPPFVLYGHDIMVKFINKDTGAKFCPRNLTAAEIAYVKGKYWQITLDYDCESDHLTSKWLDSREYFYYDLFVVFGKKDDPANTVCYSFRRPLKLISWRFTANADDVASGRIVFGAHDREIVDEVSA